MDVVTPGSETDSRRETFFRLVFGKAQGLVCIAFLSPERKFREEYYEYPAELPQMLAAINGGYLSHNVYFCPQLLRERRRTKENVVATPNVWADLDQCPPENMLLEPSVVLESSPGRYQAFWVLEKEFDPDDVEDTARRIAYKHADEGADRSGWDLTQLLRVPYTYNYKYTKLAFTPVVKIIDANRAKYRLTDFGEYPPSPEYISTDMPMPEAGDLTNPDGTPLEAEALLQSRRTIINPLAWRLYNHEPEGEWSGPLWNLLMILFETGFTREEVYVIARESKCNKWARDKQPARMLWKEVCRAEARSELNSKLIGLKPRDDVQLLSDSERARVASAGETFIERYQEWASQLGDAAPQYHQAGAFVALSSVLAGSVRLPTSYGTIVPNIWFMILADTTLTRKTTSMDIAMDLVMEVDEDVVMATDGSLEGLLTSLAARPSRPSVFLRDEFSGLLEQMTKKDYMAGMPELLTKLYDGKFQKRVLRKEVIEVRDPRLIIFAGGIKNKITSLLSFEHVSSGFMPRFVFITAESDLARVRPIGPPTARTTGNRDAIRSELEDMAKHYNRTTVLTVDKLKAKIEQPMVFDVEMTDDAWVRYNMLESGLLEAGLKSERPETMTPVGDRLAKSILKAALLIAASRQRGEGITIEEIDILRAIQYGEQWRMHAVEVMDNVGKGQAERQLDTIYNAIKRKGIDGGVSRSNIMQAYHLNARETTQIFETLEQRGLIRRQKSGRTEILLAVD